jgi:hypothetical protein
MKRKISIIALFTAISMSAAILTGCSAAPMDYATNENIRYETTAAAYAPEYAMDGAAADFYSSPQAAAAGELSYDAKSADGGEVTPVSEQIGRKVIRNAEITVKTLDAIKSDDAITAKITELGGYIYTSDKSENEFSHNITTTYKISPEGLQTFYDWIAETETVTNAAMTADDITTQYYDSEIRLDTLRRTLEKYYQYLEDAYSIDEMLMIQQQIDRITMEIESFEGQIRVWDVLTAESTVTVHIHQTPDPTRAELEDISWDELSWENVGTLMSNGIRSVLYGILAVFQWLLITIVTISPLLVIIAIIVLIIVTRSRKKRAKMKALADEKAAKEAEMKAEAYVKAVDMGYAEPPAGTDPTPETEKEKKEKPE